MKKLFPFFLYTLFFAISCEDEVEDVNCATRIANLGAMPFSDQLINFDILSEVTPENWKENCEAYMVAYQAAYDNGCLEDATAEDVTILDELCDVYDGS